MPRSRRLAILKFNATSPSSFYVGMLAPALSASYSLTWPMDDGNNGEVLTTNGSGVLSWAPAAAASQWTTQAPGINYMGGNVGIGTTSPVGILDVRGGTTATGAGTNINLVAQASTVNNGGSINLNGGDASNPFTAGSVKLTGGTGVVAGDVVLKGGTGLSATAGNVTIVGGDGAGNPSTGGSVNISGGVATTNAGHGGAVNITGGNATASGLFPNRNGGNVVLTAGAPTGTGANGVIQLMGGNVGIGTTSPFANLDVYAASTATSGTPIGSAANLNVNPAANSSAVFGGSDSRASIDATNTFNFTGEVNGDQVQANHYGSGTAATLTASKAHRAGGTITDAYGVNSQVRNISTGTITNAYGIYSNISRTAGTVTNGYGVYISPPSGAIGNYYGLFSASGANYFGGNVGIGTSSPTKLLHVVGSSNSSLVQVQNTDTNGYSAVNFYDAGGANAATIGYANSGAATVPGLAYAGSPIAKDFALITTNIERMRITSGGNVGIGTTSPGYKLDVAGAVNATAIKVNGVDVATSGGAGGGQSSTSGLTFNSNTDNTGSDGGFNFQSNGANLMTISDSGNVVLTSTNSSGNSSTGALVVAGGVGIGGALNVGSVIGSTTSSSAVYSPTSSTLNFPIGGKIAVTNSNPSANGTFAGYQMGASNSLGISQRAFMGVVSNPGAASFTPTLVFGQQVSDANSYAERMRIDAAGNVGIGTTAPGVTLDINGIVRGTQVKVLGGGTLTGLNGTDSAYQSNANFFFQNSGGANTFMTVSSAGNASGLARLHPAPTEHHGPVKFVTYD